MVSVLNHDYDSSRAGYLLTMGGVVDLGGGALRYCVTIDKKRSPVVDVNRLEGGDPSDAKFQ